jgi:SAM-dependent methyltransferase
MHEWFEKESFWRELYPYMFAEERFETAKEDIDKILALTGFKGGVILDLCCGPGRHSVPLAKRGFKVTAVDRTKFLLDKARKRARDEGVDIEWVQKDMREFHRENVFDLIINMFTSFGYFNDKRDDMKVLENMHKNLRKGGAVIMQMRGKEQMAKILQPTTSEQYPDGTIFVERHEIFDDWSRIRNEWIIIKNDKAKSFKFHHTFYSGQELKDRLNQAGFSKVKLFGNLDGIEYGPNATHLVAVAWKIN